MPPDPVSTVEWINAASTVVVAAATVVLAVTTFHSLRRERREENRHRAAVDSRVRAAGYEALLEALEAYNRPLPPDETSVGQMIEAARLLRKDLTDVADLTRRMAADAPEASPELAEYAEESFALTVRTTSHLDTLANLDPVRDGLDPLPEFCRRTLDETHDQLTELVTLLNDGFGGAYAGTGESESAD